MARKNTVMQSENDILKNRMLLLNDELERVKAERDNYKKRFDDLREVYLKLKEDHNVLDNRFNEL